MDLPNWLHNQLPKNKGKSCLVSGRVRSGFPRSLVVPEACGQCLHFPGSLVFIVHIHQTMVIVTGVASQYFIINPLEKSSEAQPS